MLGENLFPVKEKMLNFAVFLDNLVELLLKIKPQGVDSTSLLFCLVGLPLAQDLINSLLDRRLEKDLFGSKGRKS